MNNANPLPVLTAPCPLIIPSNLSIADEATLVANLVKTSLAKETARSISVFCLKYSS